MWNISHCHKCIFKRGIEGTEERVCSHFTVCSKGPGMCWFIRHRLVLLKQSTGASWWLTVVHGSGRTYIRNHIYNFSILILLYYVTSITHQESSFNSFIHLSEGCSIVVGGLSGGFISLCDRFSHTVMLAQKYFQTPRIILSWHVSVFPATCGIYSFCIR